MLAATCSSRLFHASSLPLIHSILPRLLPLPRFIHPKTPLYPYTLVLLHPTPVSCPSTSCLSLILYVLLLPLLPLPPPFPSLLPFPLPSSPSHSFTSIPLLPSSSFLLLPSLPSCQALHPSSQLLYSFTSSPSSSFSVLSHPTTVLPLVPSSIPGPPLFPSSSLFLLFPHILLSPLPLLLAPLPLLFSSPPPHSKQLPTKTSPDCLLGTTALGNSPRPSHRSVYSLGLITAPSACVILQLSIILKHCLIYVLSENV